MSKQVTGHLDDDVHARLSAEAERRDVAMSYLVVRAIQRMLPLWEQQDLDRLTRGEHDSG